MDAERAAHYQALGRAIYRRYQRRCGSLMKRALKYRLIPHPTSLKCACGSQATVYDHRDYFRPFVIEPVCQSCNLKAGRAELSAEDVFYHFQPWYTQPEWKFHVLINAAGINGEIDLDLDTREYQL